MYYSVVGLSLAFLFRIEGWVVATELIQNEALFREPEGSASLESQTRVTSSLRSKYNDTTVPVQTYVEPSISSAIPPVITSTNAITATCVDPQEYGDVVLKLLELLNLSINHDKLDLKKIDYVLDSIKKYEIKNDNATKSIETQINDLKKQLHKEEALNSKLPSRKWMVPSDYETQALNSKLSSRRWMMPPDYETLVLDRQNARDDLKFQASHSNANEHPSLEIQYLRTIPNGVATGKREIFKYEIPREGHTSCKDALLNLIQETQKAYLDLAQHPVCSDSPNLPKEIDTNMTLDTVHFPYDNMARTELPPSVSVEWKHIARTSSNVTGLGRNTLEKPVKYEQDATKPVFQREVNVNTQKGVQSLQSLQIRIPSLESRFSGTHGILNQYNTNNIPIAHNESPYQINPSLSNPRSYVQNNSPSNALPFHTPNRNGLNSLLNKLTQATLHSAQMPLMQVPAKSNPMLNGLVHPNSNPIDHLLYLQKLFKPRDFSVSQARLVSGDQNIGSYSGLQQPNEGQQNIAQNLNQYHQTAITNPNQNVQTPVQYQNHLNMWYSQQNSLQLSEQLHQPSQNVAALDQETNRKYAAQGQTDHYSRLDNSKLQPPNNVIDVSSNAENGPPGGYNQVLPRKPPASSTSNVEPVLLEKRIITNNNPLEGLPTSAQGMAIQSSTLKNSLSSLLQQNLVNPSSGQHQQDPAHNYVYVDKLSSVDPIQSQNPATSNSQSVLNPHLTSLNSNNLNQIYQQSMISQQNPYGLMVQETVPGLKQDIYQMLHQETLKAQMKIKSQVKLSNPGETIPGETNQAQSLNQIQASSLSLNPSLQNQGQPLNINGPVKNNLAYPEQLNVFHSKSSSGKAQAPATNQNNLHSGLLPSVDPMLPMVPQASQNVNDPQSVSQASVTMPNGDSNSYQKEQSNWNFQQGVPTDQNMLPLQYPLHQNDQSLKPAYPSSHGLNPFPPPETHAEWIYQQRFLNPSFDNHYKKQNGHNYGKVHDSQQFGVTNRAELNNLPINADAIELTYVINRPQPMIYKPYYYVKYKIPYKAFMDDIQKILYSKPYMRTHPDQLYSEVLTAANVTETSPDLKDLSIKELQQLVAINGTLAKAKLMNQGAEVNLLDHQKTNDQNALLSQLFGEIPTNNVNNPIVKRTIIDPNPEDTGLDSKMLRTNSLSPPYRDPTEVSNINSGVNNVWRYSSILDGAQQYNDLERLPQEQMGTPWKAMDYSRYIYDNPESVALEQWKQLSRSYHPIYIHSDYLNPAALEAFEQLKRNAKLRKLSSKTKKTEDTKKKLKEERLKQLLEAQKALAEMEKESK